MKRVSLSIFLVTIVAIYIWWANKDHFRDDTVKIQIAGSEFLVPNSYIWLKFDNSSDVVYRLKIPDMVPLGLAEDSLLKMNRLERGENQIIVFTLREDRVDRLLNSILERKDFEPLSITPVKGLNGYISNSRTRNEIYIPKENVVEYKAYVVCSSEGRVKFPGCDATVEYDENIVISYNFYKKLLPNWFYLNDKMLRLISQFEVLRAPEQ